MWKVSLSAQWPRALLLASTLSALFSRTAYAEDESYAIEPASPAAEEGAHSLLPFRIDLHGVLTWEAEFGTGLRADIPIFSETSYYNGRDEIALSVGGDLSFVTFGGKNRVTVWPTVTLQWSLSVSERFVLSPEVGIVAQVQPRDFKGLFPNVGISGRIHAYGPLEVLVRLGWPMAVTVGITF